MGVQKKITGYFIIALVLIVAVYGGLWLWMASEIRKQTNDFIANASKNNVHFITRSLTIDNFPFTPQVHFKGLIHAENKVIEIPELIVQSMFVIDRPLTAILPQGAFITEPTEDREVWSINYARVETIIPSSIPETLTHEDLSAWKANNGSINIDLIELKKETLEVVGKGFVTVDDTLQPEGTFNAKVTGHIEFLNWLQEKKYIETREAMMTAAILTSLSKADPDSGKTTMNVSLSLQNRTLYLGPLRLASLPEVRWAWRSRPGPLE